MPTSTPGGAAWRSAVLTQPSSSTRVHSPERPSTRSGAEGASVPAGGPSGARYSTVRRADSRREGSTGADEPVVVSGALTPGRRPGVGAAPAGVAATCSTSPFSTQPLRVTWIQLSVEPSATRVSRKPGGSLPTSAPAGAERRFSSGARVTARSYPARAVAPTEVAKIHPSSVTPSQSPFASPAPRAPPAPPAPPP